MGNSLIMELRPLGAAQTLLATVDTGTTPVAAAANRATNQRCPVPEHVAALNSTQTSQRSAGGQNFPLEFFAIAQASIDVNCCGGNRAGSLPL